MLLGACFFVAVVRAGDGGILRYEAAVVTSEAEKGAEVRLCCRKLYVGNGCDFGWAWANEATTDHMSQVR